MKSSLLRVLGLLLASAISTAAVAGSPYAPVKPAPAPTRFVISCHRPWNDGDSSAEAVPRNLLRAQAHDSL